MTKYAVRRWSVRNARLHEWLYRHFEGVMMSLHPLWLKVGYTHVEKPIIFIERLVKGFLFDCKMCGCCVLNSTGMSCPMNCPKKLRNGPCGGVRSNGMCEIKGNMACVWVEAWHGSQRMKQSENIMLVLPPLDHSKQGRSSWLREVRAKRDQAFYDN